MSRCEVSEAWGGRPSARTSSCEEEEGAWWVGVQYGLFKP